MVQLWVTIIDLGLLIGLPMMVLQSPIKGIIFFLGFALTQIQVWVNPWLELIFEVLGVCIMLLVCTYKKNELEELQ